MENISLNLPDPENLNLPELLIGLALCIVASFILRFIYVSRSHSLSGKFHIGTVIPLLAVVTFLVIVVVKSSLALSLGLVGALSVIRFRTPIKEPEELVYLFLAIALGLGYGAGQVVATSVVFLVALGMIWFFLSRKSSAKSDEYNFLIDWTQKDVSASALVEVIGKHAETVDLQKFDEQEGTRSLFLKVHLQGLDTVEALSTEIRELVPEASVSFFEGRPVQ